MTDIIEDGIPFPEAAAPWKCKGEAFWFFGYDKGAEYPPPSYFSPLERTSTFGDPEVTGKFKGGLSSLMVVRYAESPVGMWPLVSCLTLPNYCGMIRPV